MGGKSAVGCFALRRDEQIIEMMKGEYPTSLGLRAALKI